MPAIRFVIARNSVTLENRGKHYSSPTNCLIVTDNYTKVIRQKNKADTIIMDFYCSDLQQLYSDIEPLLQEENGQPLGKELVKVVMVEKEVIDLFSSVANLSAANFLQFCYIYCLNIDRHYFSSLLRKRTSSLKEFCDFIEENFLERNSLKDLSNKFNLPARKFSQLFHDTYGKSAKRWILERRLEHARELLITTSMRVLDIALECGFSNHAHFTDSFSRHFSCNPSQVRQRMLKQNTSLH